MTDILHDLVRCLPTRHLRRTFLHFGDGDHVIFAAGQDENLALYVGDICVPPRMRSEVPACLGVRCGVRGEDEMLDEWPREGVGAVRGGGDSGGADDGGNVEVALWSGDG